MARYEINHKGTIVQSETQLCRDKDALILELFSQFGWEATETHKDGPYQRLSLQKDGFETIVLNVFSGNIRNESRNDYEKKIQLNGKDPLQYKKENTIILGVYVFEENDSLADAVFVGYPIDDNVKYSTNPSLRGAFVNGVLIQGKNKGFYFDSQKNLAAFRSEFIFYYLDNYKRLHYGAHEPIAELKETQRGGVTVGKNIILYGVPGCGKSHEIKKNYCNDKRFMERVVFHPDYTYSDFVGQILPRTDGEKISYPFTEGPFTTILRKAIHDPENMYYLVIEEINRGNAPAIFGEVFQLLDRENGESEYGINNFDIAKCIYGPDGAEDEIKIPSNLTILATMNTADQNVFTLDTAFKRRWTLRSIPNDVGACDHAAHKICGTSVTWKDFATKINDTIIDFGQGNLSSEDNRLGAYFVKADDLQDEKLFAEKILMYLWNDAFKYERDKVFNPEYRTLEELLNGFYDHKFGVFVPQFGFNDTSNQGQPATSLAGNLSEDEHLRNKRPELVELYSTIREMVRQRVANLYTYTPNSKAYIGLGSNDNKRKSFAEFIIKKDHLSLEVEKPRDTALQNLGEEIEYNGSHDHYFKIAVTEDSNLELIVDAIFDSYEQLK